MRGPQIRTIELDVDIGADARDWAAIQAAEKLKPVEIELRRIEEVTGEIVKQMEYLRRREQKLRDTNESTNERVKWFAFAVMATLVGLGGWQVVYLRAYFRYDGSRLRRCGGGTDVRIGQSILSRRGCFGDGSGAGKEGWVHELEIVIQRLSARRRIRRSYRHNFSCLLDHWHARTAHWRQHRHSGPSSGIRMSESPSYVVALLESPSHP